MKIFTGKVISRKMEKTATVTVGRVVAHPVYKKRFKRTKKYHVHDELGTKVGDKVKFIESRPYSKLKRWKIIEVISAKEKVTRKIEREKKTEKKGGITKARKAHKGTKR